MQDLPSKDTTPIHLWLLLPGRRRSNVPFCYDRCVKTQAQTLTAMSLPFSTRDRSTTALSYWCKNREKQTEGRRTRYASLSRWSSRSSCFTWSAIVTFPKIEKKLVVPTVDFLINDGLIYDGTRDDYPSHGFTLCFDGLSNSLWSQIDRNSDVVGLTFTCTGPQVERTTRICHPTPPENAPHSTPTAGVKVQLAISPRIVDTITVKISTRKLQRPMVHETTFDTLFS